MLTPRHLRSIRLYPKPLGQILAAQLLSLDFDGPRPTEIVLEGEENLPDRPVFLAMNHTDRFNYLPFFYTLQRRGMPYTATWVKGKYYEHALTRFLLEVTNNIPMPSRGYVIAVEFSELIGRAPKGEEYRVLRNLVNEKGDRARRRAHDVAAVRHFLDLAERRYERPFLEHFVDFFRALMNEVVRLNKTAFANGNYVLVFPQGTRSRRLSAGHSGLVQMAQHMGADIVPIGCNGTDRLYPGSIPFARQGRAVYRIGEPLTIDGPELSPYRVTEPFVPLTRAATEAHGREFQRLTDVVMDHVNELLDEEYQYAPDYASDGVAGVNRFL